MLSLLPLETQKTQIRSVVNHTLDIFLKHKEEHYETPPLFSSIEEGAFSFERKSFKPTDIKKCPILLENLFVVNPLSFNNKLDDGIIREAYCNFTKVFMNAPENMNLLKTSLEHNAIYEALAPKLSQKLARIETIRPYILEVIEYRTKLLYLTTSINTIFRKIYKFRTSVSPKKHSILEFYDEHYSFIDEPFSISSEEIEPLYKKLKGNLTAILDFLLKTPDNEDVLPIFYLHDMDFMLGYLKQRIKKDKD